MRLLRMELTRWWDDSNVLPIMRDICDRFSTPVVMIYLLVYGGRLAAASMEDHRSGNRATATPATFNFPEYTYKETSKNEITYREFEATCEHTAACENLEGVTKVHCIRCCISNSCYEDIYAFDELEEGEIDVRLNSFKGCVIQRSVGTNRLQHRDDYTKRLHNGHLLDSLPEQLSSLLRLFL